MLVFILTIAALVLQSMLKEFTGPCSLTATIATTWNFHILCPFNECCRHCSFVFVFVALAFTFWLTSIFHRAISLSALNPSFGEFLAVFGDDRATVCIAGVWTSGISRRCYEDTTHSWLDKRRQGRSFWQSNRQVSINILLNPFHESRLPAELPYSHWLFISGRDDEGRWILGDIVSVCQPTSVVWSHRIGACVFLYRRAVMAV